MKVYSYRNFEKLNEQKNFTSNSNLLQSAKRLSVLKNPGINFNFFESNNNFIIQIFSVCLLTLGILLGFQVITDNSEITTLASESTNNKVRVLNNFGRNTSSDNNSKLQEIVEDNVENDNLPESADEKPQLTTVTYTVKSGDNLYSIAQDFGVDFIQIAKDNELNRPYNLQVEQQLYINSAS